MKERLGVLIFGVILTFVVGFALQDPKTKNVKGNDKDFVMKVAKDGKAEVELGNLALTKASSEDVKQFAQRLIDDHSKANDELTQLAQSKGITLPSASPADKPTGTEKSVDAESTATMERLNRLSGAEFDREYIRLMVMDHDKAVTLFEKQASGKDGDAEIKSWAEKTLPTLREHQRMAHELAGKVGAKPDSSAKKVKQ